MSLNVQVVELYFNDCYDLLNNKAKVMIQGFGRNTKVNSSVSPCIARNIDKRDAKGKWVPPALLVEKKSALKDEYEMAGTKDVQITDI